MTEEQIKIKTDGHRYGVEEQALIKDLFSRRYKDYYSWMMPEVDIQGGLMTLGRIAIIGGPHGVGKTTYITELAKFNSCSKKTMLIPLEMGADFTVMMLACNMFNNIRPKDMKVLGYGELEEGYLYQRPERDQQLFKKCVNTLYIEYPNLFVKTPETLSFEELKAFILQHHLDHGIKFFIIDHLHQLDTSESDNETSFYSMVAKELKELSYQLGIALLCVVQLTKAANSSSNPLDLASFKGTSEFTSNAHRVVLIKKPTLKVLGKTEAKAWIKKEGLQDSLTIQDAIDGHEEAFTEATRHVRELVFLKTRGREGGVMTIEMNRGEFEFMDYGPYRNTTNPLAEGGGK